MAGERTSLYLTAGLTAAVKASGVPLAGLIRRGLAAAPAPAAPVTDRPVTLPAGEPCPGVACMDPGCWNRGTARYGLRRLVLCRACAAALQGATYQRELAPGAARLVRRGAAIGDRYEGMHTAQDVVAARQNMKWIEHTDTVAGQRMGDRITHPRCRT